MMGHPAQARALPPARIAARPFWIGLALALFAAAMASHWPVRHGYFGIDDFFFLDVSRWRSVAASFIGSQGAHDVYRPIFRLSFYLDVLLLRGHPGAMHIENVAIHATNALLLAVVARSYKLPLTACVAAALLFVFSPLSGEAVDWISGRSASLCFLFMLLALWRWTVATAGHRVPLGAAIWMTLGSMTYEAGVILPAVLVCLIPLARKQLEVGWRLALRQILPLVAVMAAFIVARAVFLGRLVGYSDAASPDLWGNFKYQMFALHAVFGNFGNALLGWWLVAALILTTVTRGFFPAGPCLAAASLVLELVYINAAGAGERFFYMMQAPLCVLAVLPALAVKGRLLRILGLTVILAVLIPPLVPPIWREAVLFTDAGGRTRAMIAAIHQTMPADGGGVHVVEGVPDFYDYRPMMGGYFEVGIADSYGRPNPPLILRSQGVLASPSETSFVLRVPARYWRYDAEGPRLLPLDREDWLALHPEARALLPK